MQTNSRFISTVVCALFVLLVTAKTFAQNAIALDTKVKLPTAGDVLETRRESTPHSDTERINALEETLRQQGA
ncbi:MAG: hypothetical protein ABJB97_07710, partial [Acidobacteriota bacterium]